MVEAGRALLRVVAGYFSQRRLEGDVELLGDIVMMWSNCLGTARPIRSAPDNRRRPAASAFWLAISDGERTDSGLLLHSDQEM